MLSISATSVLYCSTWLQTWSVVTNFVKPLWRTEEWAVGTCFANKAVAQKRQKPPRYKKTWLGLQLGFSCNVTRCHNWRSRAAKYGLWRCMSNNWVTRSQVSESNDVKWSQQLIGLVLLCFIPDISRGAHLFHAAQRCAVKGTLSLGCAQQWPIGIDCIILYMGTVSFPAYSPMISFHRARFQCRRSLPSFDVSFPICCCVTAFFYESFLLPSSTSSKSDGLSISFQHCCWWKWGTQNVQWTITILIYFPYLISNKSIWCRHRTISLRSSWRPFHQRQGEPGI